MRVLTLTCSFPNPLEPGHSPFVRNRLAHLARYAEVEVIAPVPLVDYSNPKGDLWQSFRIPAERRDGDLRVFHPKWLFPPLGTPVNIPCLYVRALAAALGRRRQFPFHLIDSHFAYPDGVAAAWVARTLRVPYCITLRGNELVFGKSAGPRQAMSWALRHAAGAIGVSNQLREYAVALGAAPERVRTIGNGVDGNTFQPLPGRDAMRREAGLGPQAKLIFTAGGLGPGKGHHRIVEALPVLLGQGHDVLLWIAGSVNRDGRYEAEIRDTVRRLGLEERVKLLGSIPPASLAKWMNCADLFCLASSSEGWPNVVHEALACGTPVVATRVGAIPEMVASGRGVIVPPDDTPALAQGLLRGFAQEWDRERISAWGRARSWDHVAREVYAFFVEILERGKKDTNDNVRH